MENETHHSPSLFMKILEWVATLAYLNILWIAFSLLGLVVFGIGPATITVYALIRKKLRQGDLSHIFTLFRKEFRKQLNPGNIYFPIVMFVGIFLYIDMRIISVLPESMIVQMVVIPALFILTALAIVVATFTLGYYVENEESIFRSFHQGFWVTLISPVSALVIIHALLLQFLILTYIPAFILFFSMSLYAFVTEWIMNKSFNRIKRRKKSI
ncbi:MAG: DUF624 domain-containing protein [Alkalibacterium sp.]|nr:DUF624 domain-containing protein [Alkalibacterium sp.]